jgi:ABC-type dipeptide/oligopeptide/nickel transport system permease component
MHGDLGSTVQERPVLAVLRQRAPITLWLIVSALVGGYALGVALGMIEATGTHRPLRTMTCAAAVLLVSLPLASLAALTAYVAPASGSAAGAVLLMLLVTLALVSRYQHCTARSVLSHEHCITLRALGAGPGRLAIRCLKNSSLATASLLGVHLPTLLTAAFVLEHAFGLAGLGEVSLRALQQGDVSWLMALALGTVVVVALAQAASDLILAALDPQVRTQLARGQGSRQ